MIDTVVVGGGLFGQVIAKALRAQGKHVEVIDAKLQMAGSIPAACLMKPSWFTGLGEEVFKPALAMLDSLYGIQDIEFDVTTAANIKIWKQKVHWIPPADILSGSITKGYVTKVEPGRVEFMDNDGSRHELECKEVVVAAGIWTDKLIEQYRPDLAQKGQTGVAFLWADRTTAPKIYPWAPYKQLVKFNRGDGVWVGDGTTIKPENWNRDRLETSLVRSWEYVDPQLKWKRPEALVGIRPYAKGHKPCMLEKLGPGLWVASGGAKNGTLAAGWAAHRLVEELT